MNRKNILKHIVWILIFMLIFEINNLVIEKLNYTNISKWYFYIFATVWYMTGVIRGLCEN